MNFILKILRLVSNEVALLFSAIIINYPNGAVGNSIRKYYWSKLYNIVNSKSIGKGAYIISRDQLVVGENIVLGDRVAIENTDSNGCYIGDFVGIARGAYIRTADHNTTDIRIPWMKQGHIAKKIDYKDNAYSIVIEDDVWIGANAIVLSGAHIGKGVIVSAGSVVHSNIPEYSVIVGNPARVVANRKKLFLNRGDHNNGSI